MTSDKVAVADADKVMRTLMESQLMINEHWRQLTDIRGVASSPSSRESDKEEIINLQKKLMRHFAKQIVAKRSLGPDFKDSRLSAYPDFTLWLQVINVKMQLTISFSSNFESLETLLQQPAEEIVHVCEKCGADPAETNKLIEGIACLQLHIQAKSSASAPSTDGGRKKPAPIFSLYDQQNQPPPLSSNSLSESASALTPPPNSAPHADTGSAMVTAAAAPLHRCASLDTTTSHLRSLPHNDKSDLSDEGYSTNTSSHTAGDRSPGINPAAVSPPVSGGKWPTLYHSIHHRFEAKNVNFGYCDVCSKFLVSGVRCKHCKYKCHKKCQSKVPPSCGMSPKLQEDIRNSFFNTNNFFGGDMTPVGTQGSSPSSSLSQFPPPLLPPSPLLAPGGTSSGSHTWHHRHNTSSRSSRKELSKLFTTPHRHRSESTTAGSAVSGSSLPSSANSSPGHLHTKTPVFFPNSISERLLSSQQQQSRGPGSGSCSPLVQTPTELDHSQGFSSRQQQTTTSEEEDDSEYESNDEYEDEVMDVVMTSGSRNSENTSATLTDSEKTASGGAVRDFSSSEILDERRIRAVDDDYDDISSLRDVTYGEEIGRGRFAVVHKGFWHGDVAIKTYHQQWVQLGRFNARASLASAHQSEMFMSDIKTLCKARHQNIVLFMAAYRKPPQPAIITSLCKGKTLYKKIHINKESDLSISTIVNILEQVAQGMGYLHGRAIVHKDLRTKNIFVDETRHHVTITDYGLANITKLVHNHHHELAIFCSRGWLSYLAPELIRDLACVPGIDQALEFTFETDVYAFGTVWYELMAQRFLHQDLPPHVLIYTVGRGCKNSLFSFHASKQIKDFLLSCWYRTPEKRPLFSQIHSFLKELDNRIRMDKSLLKRCPSQPTPISRSMERIAVY